MNDVCRTASALLFIGDVHLSSMKPGRRKDEDYPQTILGKVEKAIEIANEQDAVPVFLGDMFDLPVETDESIKTRLIRTLNLARHRAISNVGNHDTRHAALSDQDTLSIIAESRCLDLIRETGPFGVLSINGKRVGLGGTPYGQSVPRDVTMMFPDVSAVVWLTHDNFEFDAPYPGSIPTHEVQGCRLVVNGHIHSTKRPVRTGTTTWFNPGNITRQSIDAMMHVPCVWKATETGKVEPIPLPYEKAVFDLTGKLVKAEHAKTDDLESAFVQLIMVEMSADMEKSDDGSLIWEQIAEKFRRDDTPEAVQAMIANLLDQAVTARPD